MSQVLVQLVVLFGCDVFGRALPERRAAVDRLEFVLAARLQQLDGIRQIVGVALHQLPQPIRIGVFERLFFEMQDDAGADRWALCLVDAEAALARGLPAVGFFGAGGSANHLDALGHQERAVEADTELTDELGQVARFGALAFELFQEFART